MSRDPEDGVPTEPASLHKYLYANGDPVNMEDSSGRDAYFEGLLLRVAIVGAYAVQVVQGMNGQQIVVAVGALACVGKGLKAGYDLLGTLLSEVTKGKWNLWGHEEPGPDDPIDQWCHDFYH